MFDYCTSNEALDYYWLKDEMNVDIIRVLLSPSNASTDIV